MHLQFLRRLYRHIAWVWRDAPVADWADVLGRTPITRRRFVASAAVATGLSSTSTAAFTRDSVTMYGLIGKIRSIPGKRDELSSILIGMSGMPGCRSYVVANDSEDPDALWVTEVWDSQESHVASLALPSVQEAIRLGRPLIASFAERTETEPIGGLGLL